MGLSARRSYCAVRSGGRADLTIAFALAVLRTEISQTVRCRRKTTEIQAGDSGSGPGMQERVA